MGKVRIYSNKHQGWWRPEYNGYTDSEEEAGVFEKDDVQKTYPEIGFNEYNTDYLVAVDPKTIIEECIYLLGRTGINSKDLVRHKLHNLLPMIKEE